MTTTGVMCHLALVSQFLTDPEGRGGGGELWNSVVGSSITIITKCKSVGTEPH